MILKIGNTYPNSWRSPQAFFFDTNLRAQTISPRINLKPAAIPLKTDRQSSTAADDLPSEEIPDYSNPVNLADREREAEIAQTAYDLLQELWQQNPEARFSANDAKELVAKARRAYEVKRRFDKGDVRIDLWNAIASGDVKQTKAALSALAMLSVFKSKSEALNSGDGIDPHSFISALALGGNKEILDFLRRKGMDLTERMSDGSTLLHAVARERGKGNFINDLLDEIKDGELDLSVNDMNGFGDTPLTFAIKNGNPLKISALVHYRYKTSQVIDLNLGNPPPVILAASVEPLYFNLRSRNVDYAASVNFIPNKIRREWLKKKETENKNYLDETTKEQQKKDFDEFRYNYKLGPEDGWEVATGRDIFGTGLKALLSTLAHFNVNVVDSHGRNAIHIALVRDDFGNPFMTRIALNPAAAANLCDIDGKDDAGWTPLAYAAYDTSGDKLMELLLEKGANPKIKNKSGQTPLDICLEKISRLDTPGAIYAGSRQEQTYGKYSYIIASGADKIIKSGKIDLNGQVTSPYTNKECTLVELAIEQEDLRAFDLLDRCGARITDDQREKMEKTRKAEPSEDKDSEDGN